MRRGPTARRRIRPTTRGTGAAATAAALAVLGAVTAQQLATAAAVLIAALLGVCGVWTLWRTARTELLVPAPPRLIAAGTALRLQPAVQRSRWDAGPVLVSGLSPPWCEGPDRWATAQAGPSVGTVELRARDRGRHHGPTPRARLTDAFGLWRAEITVPGRHEVLVVPRPLPLPRTEPGSVGGVLPAGELVGAAAPGVAPPGPIPRPYQTGDDWRRIHWPATARSADPMVRAEEPAPDQVVAVVLDTATTAYPDGAEGFERAVVAAASAVAHYTALGWQVDLDAGATWQSGGVAVDALARGADVLARLAPLAEVSLGDPEPGRVVGRGRVILVTGTGESPLIRSAVARTTGRDAPVMLTWPVGADLAARWLTAHRPWTPRPW